MNQLPFSHGIKWVFAIMGLLGLGLIKLFLVEGLSVLAAGGPYDDFLFIRLAERIASGAWLGEFNHLTLIKGPFYPVWIALSYKIGVPLFLSQQILYWVACVVFVWYLSSVVSSRILLGIIFFLLLFNPMTFTPTVMRSGIYPALTLLVISFALGVTFSMKAHFSKQVTPSILLGISLSAFWFTREEGVWILPFLILIFSVSLFRFIRNGFLSPWILVKKAFLLLLPFLILGFCFFTVSMINRHYYDVFAVVEIKTKIFEDAYGSLLRVKHDKFRLVVPVSTGVLEKLYATSPAFRELQPFLEGSVGKSWKMGNLHALKKLYEQGSDPVAQAFFHYVLYHDKSGVWRDVLANISPDDADFGSFLWAFRDAVASAGYYESAEKTREFYSRLAKEIDSACDNGTLDCRPKTTGLMPPWRNDYLIPLAKMFFYSFYYVSGFFDGNVSAEPGKFYGDEASLELYRRITRAEIQTDPARYNEKRYRASRSVLQGIWILYHWIFPWLALLSLLSHMAVTAVNIKDFFSNENLVIASALLISISVLLLGLALIHVSSFPGMVTRYLAPLYPAMIIYIVFVAASVSQNASDKPL